MFSGERKKEKKKKTPRWFYFPTLRKWLNGMEMAAGMEITV